MRVFLRVFSTPQSTATLKLGAHTLIQITRAHTYEVAVTECSDTFGPVLFSKQIMTSKHALLSFQIHSFLRDHKLDVSERLKTLKPTTMNLGCHNESWVNHRVPNGETIKTIILPILPLYFLAIWIDAGK